MFVVTREAYRINDTFSRYSGSTYDWTSPINEDVLYFDAYQDAEDYRLEFCWEDDTITIEIETSRKSWLTWNREVNASISEIAPCVHSMMEHHCVSEIYYHGYFGHCPFYPEFTFQTDPRLVAMTIIQTVANAYTDEIWS